MGKQFPLPPYNCRSIKADVIKQSGYFSIVVSEEGTLQMPETMDFLNSACPFSVVSCKYFVCQKCPPIIYG
jgi:hypothetical protein